jgi:arginyl-tRNA synthetase
MNVFAHVEALIKDALTALIKDGALQDGLDLSKVAAELPKDPAHGDFATSIALALAKPAGKKPREIADALAAKLSGAKDVAKAEVAGPGFVNITMVPSFWHGLVSTIVKVGKAYGAKGVGKSETVNVEYVSANPTGPMHVGHCRGAVFGDVLANLLAFAGYDVTREYYINDAGGQVDVLARSAHLRYREALGEKIEIPEGLYPGDYLVPVGNALAEKYGKKLVGKPEAEWLAEVRSFAIDAMMDMIRDDLATINIKHDVFVSEASLTRGGTDKVKAAIDALEAKGLIYKGRLERPKDHVDDEWEDREQTLFKSTLFGDEADRALQKSDGSYTYFAGDIAYHYDKVLRGYRHLINVFGADHIGYITRLTCAVAAFGGGKANVKNWSTEGGKTDIEIKVVQLVKLFKDGQPFKMGKRAGNFVTLRDVVDEVGRDPVRFMMLYRKELEPLDFDFAKVTEQSKENPVFYVQYTHARAASVATKALEVFPNLDLSPAALARVDLSALTDEAERALIHKLAEFPRMINGATGVREPHRVAFYLHELSAAFHSLYARGNDLPHLRFIQANDRTLTLARLALVQATKVVISSGLAILGVEAPDAM